MKKRLIAAVAAVRQNKLAAVAFLLPFVGMPVAALILARQRALKAEEREREEAKRLERAWR